MAWTIITSADLTGQANHLGVTIQADIIKTKACLPTMAATWLPNTEDLPAGLSKLTTDHPSTLPATRYKLLQPVAWV